MVAQSDLSLERGFFERGDYESAAREFRHRLAEAEAAGDAFKTAMALRCLGYIEQCRGHFHQALEYGRLALTLYRRLEDDNASARLLMALGQLHQDVGELAQAHLSFRSALMLAERTGESGLRADIQIHRARLAFVEKDFDAAHNYCDEGYYEYVRNGTEVGLAEAYLLYGIFHREHGSDDLAIAHYSLALKLARLCEHLGLVAECEAEIARQHMRLDRANLALAAIERARGVLAELEARGEPAAARRRLRDVDTLYMSAFESLVAADAR